MFSMKLGIPGTDQGFADYEFRGRRNIIIYFQINYYRLILLIDLIINYYFRHILDSKVLRIKSVRITHNILIIQPKCAFFSVILDF